MSSNVETTSALSAVDYLMHRSERSPRNRSAVLGIEVLDKTPDWDRFVATYERATRAIVRMRQKVVVPAVPTASPRWVVDPDFHLDYHLRRIRLPEPGTRRQLLDTAELIIQSPLDIARPLWTVTLVEGLEGGRAAVLSHLSHAVTDGLGGVALFEQLYDVSREGQPRPMPPRPVPSDLTPMELAKEGLANLPRTTVGRTRSAVAGALGAAGRILNDPGGSVSEALGATRSIARLLGPAAVEPSPLLRKRSISSRSETLDFPLDDFKRAAKAAGGSVNDAYVAALCGALHRYHEKLGVPVEALPMAVPVSLRVESDPEAGNRFAGMSVTAPVGEKDPVQRVRLIREQIVAGRDDLGLDLFGAVAGVLTWLPDPLLDAVTESMTPADVQASNVPGYPYETYLAGCKVEHQYGLGPLPGVAMMAVFVSRAGRCGLAVRYDTASIADSELFAECLRAGFDEILALGGELGGESARSRGVSDASENPAGEAAR